MYYVFQAEDGIRDVAVTGVQTCALPILLGNGEDPEHNLYWGSAYGIKTFFSRSPDWKVLSCGQKSKHEILDRCIFKYRNANVYLVADAYRGREIQTARSEEHTSELQSRL